MAEYGPVRSLTKNTEFSGLGPTDVTKSQLSLPLFLIRVRVTELKYVVLELVY